MYAHKLHFELPPPLETVDRIGFGDGGGDTPQMDGPILRYEAEIVSNGIGSIK